MNDILGGGGEWGQGIRNRIEWKLKLVTYIWTPKYLSWWCLSNFVDLICTCCWRNNKKNNNNKKKGNAK